MNTYEPRTAFGKAMRQTYKIKRIFYNLLESFGYQDISIKMEPRRYSKEYIQKERDNGFKLYNEANLEVKNDDFYYLSPVSLYFWDDNFGYELHLDCDACSVLKNPIDIISDESTEFLLNWLLIINFLSDRVDLRCADMDEKDATPKNTERLAEYLRDKNFKIKRISPLGNMRYRMQDVYLEKNNVSYVARLYRIPTTCEYSCFDYDDNEPFEYDEEVIKPFKDLFSALIEKEGIKDYKIYLYPDLGRLSLQTCLSGVKRKIEIFSYYNDLDFSSEVEAIFEDILYYYLNDIKQNCNEILEKMQDNDFHIYSCNDSCSEVLAYRYGEKIEIKMQTEIVFDNMDGHQFEHFCANVLMRNGFENVSVTSGSGDQGIDIIAYKDDIKYGIQCKCYHSDIGNKAVQEVYAGKAYYNCHIGIVLTNRDFTRSAIELARNNGVILWNRTKLLQMIENCKDII